MTASTKGRCSSYQAFLEPLEDRPNLKIITHALVTRRLFRGNRVTGIEYFAGGSMEKLEAGTEIILCGGAINSPQLLMLSDIGPADYKSNKIFQELVETYRIICM